MSTENENPPSAQDQTILCCICGISIVPNSANMCGNCLQSQVDITEGITKQITIFQCRGCLRFLKVPNWVQAEMEVLKKKRLNF